LNGATQPPAPAPAKKPAEPKKPAAPTPVAGPTPVAELRGRVLDAVEAMLSTSAGPVHGSIVGSTIRQKFGGEIDATKWCGAGSMGKLLKASNRPGIAMDGGQVLDPRIRPAPTAVARAGQVIQVRLPLTG
jgi:hypothetical protein